MFPDFSAANLNEAELTDFTAIEGDFFLAKLQSASFHNANLFGETFFQADLTGVDFNRPMPPWVYSGTDRYLRSTST
jgi:uncharacterized protein YjbI with pentapeptide repeats